MNPGGKIYTIDEFRCWKVENLNDERSDEYKNEGGGGGGTRSFRPESESIHPT